jgi:hypothetical protein
MDHPHDPDTGWKPMLRAPDPLGVDTGSQGSEMRRFQSFGREKEGVIFIPECGNDFGYATGPVADLSGGCHPHQF